MAWRRLALVHLSSYSSRQSLHYSIIPEWALHISRPSSLLPCLATQLPKLSGISGVDCFLRDSRRWFSSNQDQVVVETGGGLVEVPLAQTGEGIAECELLKWFVQEGDEVEEFQRLCEVQSDKATIEITSRFKGKIHQINFSSGDIIKVGETLLKILTENPQIESLNHSTPLNTEINPLQSQSQTLSEKEYSGALATPAVRNLAKQHSLDINEIRGTGKEGRVLKEDVLNFAINQGVICNYCDSSSSSDDDDDDEIESKGGFDFEDKIVALRGFQRAMVKSMSLAAKVPHFHYLEEINCDALMEVKNKFQKESKDQSVKHTFLPFLIKSLSLALTKFPLLNSSFVEDTNEVILKGSHNIGVAMATQYGLVVPNIKKVQSLSILEITKELSRLHEMASNNKLNTEDIMGGTITLSNIGAIGGKFGSPLLNLPEVSIIALGRIQKLPRFDSLGNVYPASVTNVTIGADHRVVDGATVARFCNEWKNLIEKPELLLLNLR